METTVSTAGTGHEDNSIKEPSNDGGDETTEKGGVKRPSTNLTVEELRRKRKKLYRELRSSDPKPLVTEEVDPVYSWDVGKQTEYVVWIKESEVGISSFIGTHKGFNGVLKQRYSDFVVNEITPEGEVVKITDTAVPDPFFYQASVNLGVIPDDVKERLPSLLDGTLSGSIDIPVDSLSKDDRRDLHEALRAVSPKFVSNTLDKQGKKYISVKVKNPKIREKGERQLWPKALHDYVHFVMYKENIDTMAAILQMSDILRRHHKMFTYAGVKDKRAKTTQRVSVYRIEPERLNNLNKRLRNVTLGNFSYQEKSIFLGDLAGNHFQVAIRSAVGEDSDIEESVKSVKENGFLNYFGMQRFGSTSIPTHTIGRAIIKSNWKEVVELILKPREGGEENLRNMRKVWWKTRDPALAFQALWNRRTVEGRLLQGLMKHNKSLLNAIQTIPRNMRTMYVHSYQSYIWNTIVTRRIDKFGLKPIVGDLFVRGNLLEPSVEVDVNLIDDELEKLHGDTWNKVRRGDRDGSSREHNPRDGDVEKMGTEEAADAEECKTAERYKITPEVVTEANIDSVTIHDLVLPLPGYETIYPQNEIAAWYNELLDKDGVDLTSGTKLRPYSLPGSYRRLVVKPTNMTCRIVKYSDLLKPLILTDYDRMIRKTSTGEDPVQAPSAGQQEDTLKAVLLEFSLPSSSYATMLVREVTKRDTAQLTQSTDNPKQAAWDNRNLSTEDAPNEAVKVKQEEDTNSEEPNKGSGTESAIAEGQILEEKEIKQEPMES